MEKDENVNESESPGKIANICFVIEPANYFISTSAFVYIPAHLPQLILSDPIGLLLQL